MVHDKAWCWTVYRYVVGVTQRLEASGVGFSLEHYREGPPCGVHPGVGCMRTILPLFADTPEELRKLLEICSTEMTRIGLQFNQTKSMGMAWGAEQPEASWNLQGGTIRLTDTVKYLSVSLTTTDKCLTAHARRLRVQQVEAAEWYEAAKRKSALTMYIQEKREIRREGLYDNSWGSGLLAEARGGVLRTRVWRVRFTAYADWVLRGRRNAILVIRLFLILRQQIGDE
ncbi:hypothetical protein HPB48_003096 [Haemaphysalis longicornis]|uniref:Uncharacterized protein n=1 Tax=Haemaphysalis longicornis TaxID=44386 RepID=A0A9J6FYE3_HAELO|nr:hypothetical protein HPB48_003096 [Haemaphysalis longicornis]